MGTPYSVPLLWSSAFAVMPRCSAYYRFIISLAMDGMSPPTLYSLKVVLTVLSPLHFPKNFGTSQFLQMGINPSWSSINFVITFIF